MVFETQAIGSKKTAIREFVLKYLFLLDILGVRIALVYSRSPPLMIGLIPEDRQKVARLREF